MRAVVLVACLTACGRVGFDPVGNAGQGDGGISDGRGSGSGTADAAAGTGTFGTMNIGISTQNTGADRVWVSRFTLAEAAQVQTIVAHLGPTGSQSSTVRGVIYADASGTPSTLLGTTSNVMVAGTSPPGWVPLPFATSVSLAPGMYWLGVHDGIQVGIQYQSATGAAKFASDVFSDGTDATYSGGTQTFTLELSIYAEYTL